MVTITNELLEATKDNAGAFVDEAKLNMDTGFRNISNDLAHDLYSDGSGVRGAIGTISAGVITLVNSANIVQFEVGMTLQSYNSGYTISTNGALGYVIAVDRSAGQLTVSDVSVSGTAGTPGTWSTSFPNLVQQGDNPGAAVTTANALKVSGLAAWLPKVAPSGTATDFWNVARGADPVRLAGVRYDGSSLSLEEALVNAAALVAREGGQPDMCFMNFTSYAALENALGSKVQYVDVKHDEADIAFAGIRIHAPLIH